MATDGQDRAGKPVIDAATDTSPFFERWSKRKFAASQGGSLVDAKAPEDRVEEETPTTSRKDQEAKAFDPSTLPDIENLPDIESLTERSDFRVFMQEGVPSALKTKALRRLWRLKPELANLDGLLDYGEDVTGSFKVIEKLETAYRVGKGFLSPEERAKEENAVDATIVDGQDDGVGDGGFEVVGENDVKAMDAPAPAKTDQK